MAWGSTYPAAKAALVALWDAALPDTVTVVAGPAVSMGYGGVGVLTVGAADVVNPEAANGALTTEGYGLEPSREQFNINCVISVTNGNSDSLAAEAQAFQILALAGAALAPNHTLGGVAMLSYLNTYRLFPTLEDGATMRILFTVAVDAFTTV